MKPFYSFNNEAIALFSIGLVESTLDVFANALL